MKNDADQDVWEAMKIMAARNPIKRLAFLRSIATRLDRVAWNLERGKGGDETVRLVRQYAIWLSARPPERRT